MMDKLYAISIIVSTCFVYGLAAGFEDMGFYSDGFMMEHLQHLAQKRLVSSQMSGLPQLLRRLQKNSGVDVPTSDVRTTIRISGVSETGEVTLETSLPQTVEFVWALEYTRFKPIVTKGDEGIDGMMKTSSLVVKVNPNKHVTVTLALFANSSMAVYQFKLNNNTQATVQSTLFPDPTIDIPDTAQVSGDKITLEVTLPSSASNKSKLPGVTVYTYTDRESEEIEIKFLQTKILEKPTGSQITMSNVPDAIEGYLTVAIEHGLVSNPGEIPPSYRGAFIKYIYVPSTHVSYSNDTVISVDSYVTTSLPYNGTIRYGSVICMARGHPKPVITFLKDSSNISHNNVTIPMFMAGAYVSLDGKRSTEAAGIYVCKATSGNHTLTKDITVS